MPRTWQRSRDDSRAGRNRFEEIGSVAAHLDAASGLICLAATLRRRAGRLRRGVSELKCDAATLRHGVSELKCRVSTSRRRVPAPRHRTATLRRRVPAPRRRTATLRRRVPASRHGDLASRLCIFRSSPVEDRGPRDSGEALTDPLRSHAGPRRLRLRLGRGRAALSAGALSGGRRRTAARHCSSASCPSPVARTRISKRSRASSK